MDSASKAIIIAGGFLVGVLVISVSMYMLTAFRSFYDSSMNEFEAQQIMEFNSFFTQYGNVIKGYDAYNIIGKAYDINQDNDVNYFISFKNSTINPDNLEQTFYFTENLNNNYNYSYTFDADGAINNITITGPIG